jgi:GTPase SAR1 family protein
MEKSIYKITIIGDSGIGKTSLVRAITGETIEDTPTVGASIHRIELFDMILNFWDCGGKFTGLKECYYIGTNIFILMFEDRNSITGWRNLARSVSDAPIIILNNYVTPNRLIEEIRMRV